MIKPIIYNPGEYIVEHHCLNAFTVYIVADYSHYRDYDNTAQIAFFAKCSFITLKKDQYGNPIWEEKELRVKTNKNTPYSTYILRESNTSYTSNKEKDLMDKALFNHGYIWNYNKMWFDERLLPDMSKGLLINKDTKYAWQKLLIPFAGKVGFTPSDDKYRPGEDVYGCRWEKIWEILLAEKFERERLTEKRSFEMEEHMFETLRFLYQAPLIGISYDHENKATDKAFILMEKERRCFDDATGKDYYKLHIVSNMTYGVHAVCRYPIYSEKYDEVGVHVKLYLPPTETKKIK